MSHSCPSEPEECRQIAEEIGQWDYNVLPESKSTTAKRVSVSTCKHKQARSQWGSIKPARVMGSFLSDVIKKIPSLKLLEGEWTYLAHNSSLIVHH